MGRYAPYETKESKRNTEGPTMPNNIDRLRQEINNLNIKTTKRFKMIVATEGKKHDVLAEWVAELETRVENMADCTWPQADDRYRHLDKRIADLESAAKPSTPPPINCADIPAQRNNNTGMREVARFLNITITDKP